MVDWSAVYLRQSLGTGPGEAAAGFAAFSLTMAIGRLLGDGLVRRLGRVHLVQASALLATLGLGSALLMGHFWAAIVGFACAGLGYANVVPIVFSASGTQPGIPAGTGIAAAATTGYLGFLVGPPLIGLTAEFTSLPLALGLVVLFSALIIVLAPRVLRTPVPG